MLSSLFGGKKKDAVGDAPSKEKCSMYKECLEFVISNLKFSLFHHNARVDGTMLNAWEQEKNMINDQIQILTKYSSPANQRKVEALKRDHFTIEKMIADSKDPKEAKRLQGMCDMHTRFVRSLESLVPLLKEKCPDQDWSTTSEQQEEIKERKMWELQGNTLPPPPKVK